MSATETEENEQGQTEPTKPTPSGVRMEHRLRINIIEDEETPIPFNVDISSDKSHFKKERKLKMIILFLAIGWALTILYFLLK